MRKIIIPTDFSENAKNACRYALELFKYERSEIYFLHTYADEVYKKLTNRDKLEELTLQVESDTGKRLKSFAQEMEQAFKNPNHSYNSINACNYLIDEIDRIIDEEDVDIVVMGTKGITADSSLTFGSNAMQVLRYVKCPVLLIPKGYEYTQPKHIVLSTDFMIKYNRRELKLLDEFAYQYRAELEVLYIAKSDIMSFRQENNQLFIEGAMQKCDINFVIKKEKDIAAEITKYIKENEVNMLVMVNTRHSYLENILFKTTIDKVGLKLEIPFLALQNINRYK